MFLLCISMYLEVVINLILNSNRYSREMVFLTEMGNFLLRTLEAINVIAMNLLETLILA